MDSFRQFDPVSRKLATVTSDKEGSKNLMTTEETEKLLESVSRRYSQRHGESPSKDSRPTFRELSESMRDFLQPLGLAVPSTSQLHRIYNGWKISEKFRIALAIYANPVWKDRRKAIDEPNIPRTEILLEIRRRLLSKRLLVLYGMAGNGKSRLADLFFNQELGHFDQVFKVVVSGSIRESILTSGEINDVINYQISLRPELGTKNNDRWKRMFDVFATFNGVLLILDNADDLADLEESFNRLYELPACVFITSRARPDNYVSRGHVLDLGPFSQQEGEEFFVAWCKKEKKEILKGEKQIIAQIVDATYRNPELLSFVAKVYVSSYGRVSLSSLLSIFSPRSDRNKLLEFETIKVREKQVVDKLKKVFRLATLSRDESKFLDKIALLPSGPLKVTHIDQLFDDFDSYQLVPERTLDKLYNNGYIERPDSDSVSMHSLVRWIVRENEPIPLPSLQILIKNLSVLLGYETYIDWTTKSVYLPYYEHIIKELKSALPTLAFEDQIAIHMMGFNRAGIFYHLGDVDEAQRITEESSKNISPLLSDSFEHKRIKGKLIYFATVCEIGQRNERSALLRIEQELLPLYSEIYFEEDHDETITSLIDIVGCCINIYRQDGAEAHEHIERAFDVACDVIARIERSKLPNRMALASAYQTLSAVFVAQELYDEALEKINVALEIRTQELGSNAHGAMAHTYYGIAEIHRKRGSLRISLENLLVGLDIQKQFMQQSAPYLDWLRRTVEVCEQLKEYTLGCKLLEEYLEFTNTCPELALQRLDILANWRDNLRRKSKGELTAQRPVKERGASFLGE